MKKLISKNLDKFVNTLGVLCMKHNAEISRRCNMNRNLLLHPAVTSYFNYPSDSKPILFEQLLCNLDECSANIDVVSDSCGIIYLPQSGLIKTGISNGKFQINRDDTGLVLKQEGHIVPYKLKKKKFINDSNIELLPELPNLYYPDFCEYYKGTLITRNPVFEPKEPHLLLEKSFLLLKKYYPNYYDIFTKTTKLLFIHNNCKVINYISYNNHGLIVLYLLEEHDEIYFYEELIHQGAHNILNILTFNKGDFFKVDVENLFIGEYINKPNDYRKIYSVIHGLVSIALRVEGFEKLLNASELSIRQRHELYGRFADQFHRFYTLGFEYLNKDNVFTILGASFFDDMYKKCDNTLKRYKWIDDFFDLKWIDLDFRYHEFIKYNSLKDFAALKLI